MARLREVFQKLPQTNDYNKGRLMDPIEKQLQDLNLNAPRLNQDWIEATVVDTTYHILTDVLTVCVLTLKNGFTVTGESACASPANFNEAIGQQISYKQALDKVWQLEGYLLKERIHNNETEWLKRYA